MKRRDFIGALGSAAVWPLAVRARHPLFQGGVRSRIIDFALDQKIPTIGEEEGCVRQGQLIAYGASLQDVWYRGAYFVDRLLKGADPATLPVERPTKIKPAVNLKTAAAFGIKLPDTLVSVADAVLD